MEPTIYKPSIYNGAGIYKIGGGGGGGGGGGVNIQYEQIKDNSYAFAKYGNKYYTLQNLRELFSGVDPFDSNHTQNPHYLEYYDKNIFGYFYSQKAVEIIHNWFSLNSSWHIMTKDEADYLIAHFQKNEILDLNTWSVLNPLNSSMLSIPAGGYSRTGVFMETFLSSYIITDTKEDNKNFYLQINESRYQCINTYAVDSNAWPIRLCKDVI